MSRACSPGTGPGAERRRPAGRPSRKTRRRCRGRPGYNRGKWTPFRDFDDYWAPFLGGQFPAPAYAMSLDEAARAALGERIRATLPIRADGSIPLVARAWAVRGTR